jgi:hypothetical protein
MTPPQSPDRNAAADVLIERVRNNIEAHRKNLPDDWQDFIAEQVRDINAALAALRAGGEPVAWIDRRDLAAMVAGKPDEATVFRNKYDEDDTPLYATTPAAAALPERAGGRMKPSARAIAEAFRQMCDEPFPVPCNPRYVFDKIEMRAEAIDRAALNASPAADGMVLVPREPTEAMQSAGLDAFCNSPGIYKDADEPEIFADVYRAMLAAAPRQSDTPAAER